MKTVEMLSYEDSRDASRTPNPCRGGGSPVRTRVLYLPVGYVNSVPTAEKVPPPWLNSSLA